MDKVFFSIIMPTYNTPESYLRSAIESILNQTFTNFEFIIIDDGSISSPQNIIKSYKDNRIIFLENDNNMGVAGTLNKGIDSATGDYIVRMDSDDISFKNRLLDSYNFIQENPNIDIFGSFRRNFGEDSKIRTHYTDNEDIRATLLFTSPFSHPTVVMKRDTLLKHSLKYNINQKAEDYDLWIRSALNKDVIFGNIPKALLKYRVHENQTTRINDKISKSTSSIISNLFEKLDINISDDLISLYVDFMYSRRPMGLTEFKKIDDLILSIYESGKYKGLTNKTSYLKIMHEKYAKECIRQLLNHKNYVKSSYKNSSISKMSKLATKYKLPIVVLEGISKN